MNKIVAINSKSFLGSYLYEQNRGSDFEEAFLFSGTITSIAAPLIICLSYAGMVPFVILASFFLTGIAIGSVAYLRRKARCGLRFGAFENVPKAPPSGVVRIKKAA